jgi:hypothetical protein
MKLSFKVQALIISDKIKEIGNSINYCDTDKNTMIRFYRQKLKKIQSKINFKN